MKKIKSKIKGFIHKTTGFKLYKTMPFGFDPYYDISIDFKDYVFKTFFDVGANIGQTVHKIRNVFPNADIWCFEPVSSTFETLKLNTIEKNVKCFPIGFGTQNAEIKILINKDNSVSVMNSIVNLKQGTQESLIEEKINLVPLDTFCSLNSIKKIDYLKIDTEGYDLEVLKGSTEMLKKQSVSFIEAEVSMNPENNYHVKFEKIKEFLEDFGYRVYGIYDQMHEWQTQTPILRRINPLFISEIVYNKSLNTCHSVVYSGSNEILTEHVVH